MKAFIYIPEAAPIMTTPNDVKTLHSCLAYKLGYTYLKHNFKLFQKKVASSYKPLRTILIDCQRLYKVNIEIENSPFGELTHEKSYILKVKLTYDTTKGFSTCPCHIFALLVKPYIAKLEREYSNINVSEKDKQQLLAISSKLNINPVEYNYNINVIALILFYKCPSYLKALTFKELNVSPIEHELYKKCRRGGLIYVNKSIKSPIAMKAYDVNSYYPFCLTKISIPIGPPVEQKIDDIPSVIPYGFYKLKTVDKHAFFPKNYDYYTHYDLYALRALGIVFTIDTDANINCYTYPHRASGSNLFKAYVDKLYPLKSQHPIAKSLLNRLWGVLSQQKKYSFNTRYASKKEVDFELDSYEADSFDIVKELSRKSRYMGPLWRVGVFLCAYARMTLIKSLLPLGLDNVVRVHTDGFYIKSHADIKATSFVLGRGLGQLKNEGSGVYCMDGYNKPILID